MPGLRVVTPDKFDELREAVAGAARALATGQGRWDEEQAIAQMGNRAGIRSP
jgi:hypothetical protein